PLEVVAEIEGAPQRFPGAHVIEEHQRTYPRSALAAHVVGHLGKLTAEELASGPAADQPADTVGRMGIEKQYDRWLHGAAGEKVELLDHSGRCVSLYIGREAAAGRDVVLTIDPALQQTAETLLDQALERHLPQGGGPPSGGAILVLEAASGAVLAAA